MNAIYDEGEIPMVISSTANISPYGIPIDRTAQGLQFKSLKKGREELVERAKEIGRRAFRAGKGSDHLRGNSLKAYQELEKEAFATA